MISVPLHLRVPSSGVVRWAETCFLSVLMMGVSHWVEPQDPYLTQEPFPWLWLAPLLLSLRYGMWAGLSSTGLILGGLWIEYTMGRFGEALVPKSYVIGGVLAMIICGEFGSRWNMLRRQMEERVRYLSQRLHETTQAYHLLGMSHHHLEANLASRPLTLRVALSRLRGMLSQDGDRISPSGAERFLQLLTQYFELEVARLVTVDQGGAVHQSLAALGAPEPLDEKDPLVHHAFTTGEFSHVMMQGDLPLKETRYLVVAPAQTSEGDILGWLVVERMRFLNFHMESLHMLKVFLSYFADGVRSASLVRPVLERFPDCPLAFAQEVTRLVRLQREFAMHSRLIRFTFLDGPFQDEFVHGLMTNTRGLDLTWDVHSPAGRALCVLLPFSDDAAVEGYMARMQALLKERFGLSFEEAGIQMTIKGLGGVDALDILRDLMPEGHERHGRETAPELSRLS